MIQPVQIKLNNYKYNFFDNKQKYNNPVQSIKYDTVTFTSKQDLLQKSSKEITKIVKEAINDINYIGEGRVGIVYKIPDTNYCVKINKIYKKIEDNEEWIQNIDEADKINHIVAKGGKKHAIIMKFINGTHLTDTFLPSAYSLPSDSYRSLLIQLNNARKFNMYFDAAPQNIIFDKSNKTMTIIDYIKAWDIPENDYGIANELFSCLQTENYDEISQGLNRLLAKRVLGTICEELSTRKTPAFDITKSDIDRLLKSIYYTQESGENLYTQLSNAFSKIFETKDKFCEGQIIPKEISTQAENINELIQQLIK